MVCVPPVERGDGMGVAPSQYDLDKEHRKWI